MCKNNADTKWRQRIRVMPEWHPIPFWQNPCAEPTACFRSPNTCADAVSPRRASWPNGCRYRNAPSIATYAICRCRARQRQIAYVAIDGAFRYRQPFGQLARRGETASAQVLGDLKQAVGSAHGFCQKGIGCHSGMTLMRCRHFVSALFLHIDERGPAGRAAYFIYCIACKATRLPSVSMKRAM